MADAYTDTTALANLVTEAYDAQLRVALRSVPQFRSIADVRPVSQTHAGDSVTFHIYDNMSVATTPLNEITDPDAAAVGNPTPVTVTLNEYGNYAVVTKRLREFALDQSLDMQVATQISNNLADSVDALVEAVLASSTNKITCTSGGLVLDAGVTAADADATMSAFIRAVTELRSANVATIDGTNYVAFVHPRVAADLRADTAATGWLTPANYVNASGILAGEIGTFAGIRFVETPRCSETGGVYNSYVLGREALAEAVADDFHVVVDGTVVDPLNRKTAIGWTGIAGWSLFRPEALHVIESTVSS